MRVAFAADHAGAELKSELLGRLAPLGHVQIDLGGDGSNADDDYPDYARLLGEAILAEQPLTEASISEAPQAAMDACTPIDDVRGSARYRKLMVRNLTRRAVTEVWERISEQ